MPGLVGQDRLGVRDVGLVQAPGAEQIRQRATLKTNFQVCQLAQCLLAFELNAGVAPDYIQNEPSAALLNTLQDLQGAFQRGEGVGAMSST